MVAEKQKIFPRCNFYWCSDLDSSRCFYSSFNGRAINYSIRNKYTGFKNCITKNRKNGIEIMILYKKFIDENTISQNRKTKLLINK